MKTPIISDEYLNSFVDNQLDAAERVLVFNSISNDENLRERTCELHALKEMVKHAYTPPPAHHIAPAIFPSDWQRYLQPLAACLILFVGGMSGWFGHSWLHSGNEHDITSIVQSSQSNDSFAAETRKVIIQVSNSDPIKLKAALDETEALLETYNRSHRKIQLEFIANKQGVDLLRANTSKYTERINLMQEKYPNLSFMVCGQTINKLRNEGENTRLLPHTGTASSAANQINKRLHQGWGYVKI